MAFDCAEHDVEKLRQHLHRRKVYVFEVENRLGGMASCDRDKLHSLFVEPRSAKKRNWSNIGQAHRDCRNEQGHECAKGLIVAYSSSLLRKTGIPKNQFRTPRISANLGNGKTTLTTPFKWRGC